MKPPSGIIYILDLIQLSNTLDGEWMLFVQFRHFEHIASVKCKISNFKLFVNFGKKTKQIQERAIQIKKCSDLP